jgi:2-succinyl-6-hydroxy-2,4-cyclohexadiene-1-carboxylate synthase
VASLSLIGASPGLSDPVERAARRRSDDELADDLVDPHREGGGLTAFVDRWMASPLFASQVRLGTDALSEARDQRLANDPDGLAGSLRGAGTGAQPSYWHDLVRIDVPTLLVVGDEDPRFRAIAMRMAAGLAHSAIEVVPSAGHAAHLENPDHVRAVIRELLAEVERR